MSVRGHSFFLQPQTPNGAPIAFAINYGRARAVCSFHGVCSLKLLPNGSLFLPRGLNPHRPAKECQRFVFGLHPLPFHCSLKLLPNENLYVQGVFIPHTGQPKSANGVCLVCIPFLCSLKLLVGPPSRLCGPYGKSLHILPQIVAKYGAPTI